jgi:hypothetical protein
MGRQKANGAPKRQIDLGHQKANGFGGARRQMGLGDGNEPVAMKPNEMAMNPWHEAEIKGNEPMA